MDSTLVRTARRWRSQVRDALVQTFGSRPSVQVVRLSSHLAPLPRSTLAEQAGNLTALAERYLDHRFDLLGSGWVRVHRGMTCPGLEGVRYPPDPAAGVAVDPVLALNRANRTEARAIRSLIDPDYEPIDWQLDFKSGYRWSERTWYRAIRYGHAPGADVKVPWELGRMQHLPQLALAAMVANERQEVEIARRLHAEFRCQVLDFIAANPPRYGVQWASSMDVGVRIANWLLAWDLFTQAGARPDPAFVHVFARSVLAHGRHIEANLGWSRGWRTNHHLGSLVGLLFAAAYLPSMQITDRWLAFASRRVIREIDLQFLGDGGNFEGSTAYHRLSAEMAVYAVALIRAQRPTRRTGRVTLKVVDRLARAGAFTASITKPSGLVPQIGDTDSGRLFKLQPTLRPIPDMWREEHLDHRHLIDAIDGLLGRSVEGASVDAALIRGLARPAPDWQTLGADAARGASLGDSAAREGLASRIASLPTNQVIQMTIEIPGGGALDQVTRSAFPMFGVFVMRSRRVHMVVRCGPVGRHGSGGHDHNDQLALELCIDGEDRIRDPGTYLYTPFPRVRNAFRSATAHFVPQLVGPEPAGLDDGLFVLREARGATCLYWADDGFGGEHRMSDGRIALCEIRISDREIAIRHASEGAELDARRYPDLRSPRTPWSPGYGLMET